MIIDIDIPDNRIGDWEVSTFVVSEFSAFRFNIKMNKNRSIVAGKYKKLTYKNEIVMSNTPAEINDHFYFIEKAKLGGSILINGLGLGVAVVEILKSKLVTDITIIEISKEVIELSSQIFKHDKRVNIINADAMTWISPENIKYNAVWHDIWNDICGDNIKDMTKLHKKYCQKTHWQGSWCEKECQQMGQYF